MKYSYQYEKLMIGVDCLATSAAPIQKRLFYAVMSFHTLRASDFTEDELREKFTSIYDRLTTVQDPVRGAFEASTDAMSDEDAKRLASDIFELFMDVARVYYKQI